MFTRSSEEIQTKSWSPNCIKMSYDKNDEYVDEDDDDTEDNDDDTHEEDEDEAEISPHRPSGEEFEVDYDDAPTTLYLYLEDRKWEKAIQRLRENKRGPKEARTWIFRRDDTNADKDNKGIRWKILPIHASCIFRSPMALIEVLIQVYPKGLERPDDQDMLPLHLACRNGASKTVVSKIIEGYPKGVYGRDRKGRTPLDLAFASASQHRNDVVDILRTWMQKLDSAVSSSSASPAKILDESNRDASKVSHPSTPSRSVEVEITSPFISQRTMTPSATTEKASDDRTFLFQCILKKDWPGVIQRCQTHPEEASAYITTKGLHGQLHFLPLHKVCVLQPPLNVVKAIGS